MLSGWNRRLGQGIWTSSCLHTPPTLKISRQQESIDERRRERLTATKGLPKKNNVMETEHTLDINTLIQTFRREQPSESVLTLSDDISCKLVNTSFHYTSSDILLVASICKIVDFLRVWCWQAHIDPRQSDLHGRIYTKKDQAQALYFEIYDVVYSLFSC